MLMRYPAAPAKTIFQDSYYVWSSIEVSISIPQQSYSYSIRRIATMRNIRSTDSDSSIPHIVGDQHLDLSIWAS